MTMRAKSMYIGINDKAVGCKVVQEGKWVRDKIGIYHCSVCGKEAYWDDYHGPMFFDYCPYCGAEMDKGD